MKTVGIIGWRGMVGSILMQRMQEEQDFLLIEPIFFSTSNINGVAPAFLKDNMKLYDATNINILKNCDIIISCQGSNYTSIIHPKLRNASWQGYWIDAASYLRMKKNTIITLDPVNRSIIDQALDQGIKDFVGGNCTVSLMLMAIGILLKHNLVKWITAVTYQSASGAGAKNMRELLNQMGVLYGIVAEKLKNPTSAILDIDKQITDTMRSKIMPTSNFSTSLAGALIPWIDDDLGNGISKEEWKGCAESNKILGNIFGTEKWIPIDSLCVRVGVMRCHSQALTINLRKNIPIDEIENILATSNNYVKIISNCKKDTIMHLNPAAVSGTLNILIGRLRKLEIDNNCISLFTIGDQLLWGAAEPLRRMLRILIEN